MAERKFTNGFSKLMLKMHPFHRIFISVAFALIGFFAARNFHFNTLLTVMTMWDTFSFCMIVTSWIVILTRTPNQIRKLAIQEDGSLAYVYFIILTAAFASMVTVLLLMMSKDTIGFPKSIYLPIVIGGMILSWIMVHTSFTFHYARLYYSNHKEDKEKHAAGLSFPNEDCPDYLDFAYYAFVIGMTFQVSDVETQTKLFRRITLLHSFLSFGLNTFVVALTINLIASLKA